MVWSSGVTPAAVMRTRTRPSATTGLGRSTSFKSPYPVNDSARMALISTPPLQIGDAHLDRPGPTRGAPRTWRLLMNDHQRRLPLDPWPRCERVARDHGRT